MDSPAFPMRRRSCGIREESADPAVTALKVLLQSELQTAVTESPHLVERCDSGRVWLLWFAIGATEEICKLLHRASDQQRNHVFREAVGLIFGPGVHAEVGPVTSGRQLIELFEAAGAEAVRACMRGDARLGYYAETLLRISTTDLA